MTYIPHRGDVVNINFNPQAGHEQGGWRPALVLSSARVNEKSNLVLVCPITSKIKGYEFELRIPYHSEIHGVVLANHLKSLDWKKRNARFRCRLPLGFTKKVIAQIGMLLTAD